MSRYPEAERRSDELRVEMRDRSTGTPSVIFENTDVRRSCSNDAVPFEVHLHSTMRLVALARSKVTAIATARYVLPEPAGPTHSTRSFSCNAFT